MDACNSNANYLVAEGVYALLGVYCIALLITAIYTMYKMRSCTVFAVFAAVYVAAIIAIVVSEICG